jgi:hypothetical protein
MGILKDPRRLLQREDIHTCNVSRQCSHWAVIVSISQWYMTIYSSRLDQKSKMIRETHKRHVMVVGSTMSMWLPSLVIAISTHVNNKH